MKIVVTTGTRSLQSTAAEIKVSARPPLWRHQDDVELEGAPRSCAACPQVFVFQESRVKVGKDWQFFIRAINHHMTIQHISALYGYEKAFANRTGFGNPNDPRADYLKGEHLRYPDPEFDKVRTCGRSVVTGRVSGTQLIVKVFDGRLPPPLKPGRSYPQSVDDIRLDDYLFNPREHRWLFFAANIINRKGETVPFDNGAMYAWTGDGRPYTWLPHISRFEVRYSLSNLVQVHDSAPIPSSYKTIS